jgi:hypothetical protein
MTTTGYSEAPILRMQFVMLRALEGGASLDDAYEAALEWGRASGLDLFERRAYADWSTVVDEGDGVPEVTASERRPPMRLAHRAANQPRRAHASATGGSDGPPRRRTSPSHGGRNTGT